MAAKRRGIEHLSILTNVGNFEILLEEYFAFHSNFLWDKAKEFLESERDRIKNRHPDYATSIIVALLNALTQLNIADKNYMALQFFSQKFLQRKDLVKNGYSTLRGVFQHLEERGTIMNLKVQQQHAQQTTPVHRSSSASSLHNEIGQDVLNCTMEELFCREATPPPPLPPSLPTEKSLPPIIEETPKSSSSGGFFSKLFRLTPKGAQSPTARQCSNFNDSDDSIADSFSNSGHEILAEMESIEKFAAHLAGQLVNYVSVRIQMIEWFEDLADISSNRLCVVDSFLRRLLEVKVDAEENFHHPVLCSLKIMFMCECDILKSLLNLHSSIQNWQFLESLFYLQDSHNQLNHVVALREQMLGKISGGGSGNLGEKLRRNMTSSSITSSITTTSSITQPSPLSNANNSSGLQVPSLTPSANIPSPSSLLSPSFVYQNSGVFIAPKFTQRSSINFSTMPMLFQWLNKLKLFLLSKYSFYFHSVLLQFLTPTSGSNNADLLKQLLGKQMHDFHNRIAVFMKKFDNSQVVLMFNTHENSECSLSGYRSPHSPKSPPRGVNSYPIVYSYPGEFSKSRIPSLIMIVNDKKKELETRDYAVEECEKSSSSSTVQQQQASPTTATSNGHSGPSTINWPMLGAISSASLSTSGVTNSKDLVSTYYLFRPDPDFTLAFVSDCCRRPEKDTIQIIQFLQEITFSLKGTKVFSMLKTGAK